MVALGSHSSKAADPPAGDRPPLFTRAFVLLLAGGFCFFCAFGMTVPVLPLLVTERLHGNDFAVATRKRGVRSGSSHARPGGYDGAPYERRRPIRSSAVVA